MENVNMYSKNHDAHIIAFALTDDHKRARAARRIIRQRAGETWTARVVQLGSGKPALVGESYYWTTPSGKTIVRHPNAYGWRTLYHPSTLAVECGAPSIRAALRAA
jgi:hypothetical protein